jgi:ABC-type branched-subunit amino acid transport system substrate-binding protein
LTRNVRKSGWLISLCLLLIAAGAGCGRQAPARPSEDRVVLAAIGAFSGEGSDASRGIVRGVEIAIEEYNSNPANPFNAQLQTADTLRTTEGTSKAAQEILALPGLVGAVGPFRAEELAIAGPIFDAARLPFVVPSVTDNAVGGWTAFRRLVPTEAQAGEAAGADAAARARRGTVALFYDPGPLSTTAAAGAKKAVEEAKANLTRYEVIDAKTDLTKLSGGLAGETPAVTIYFGPLNRASELAKALKAARYSGRLMVGKAARDKGFTESVAEGGDGVLGTSVSADPADSRLGSFVFAHEERFGRLPAPFAAEAYEGALMLLEALRDVRPPPRPEAITNFFAEARVFLGDTKTYEFSDKGELTSSPIWILELKGGRWRLLGRSRDIRPKPTG